MLRRDVIGSGLLALSGGWAGRGKRVIPDARNWLNFHDDVLNVREFGAVGDGQADDTEPIRRGLVAAAGASRTLWFEKGTYRISSFISVNEGSVAIDGGGSTILYSDEQRQFLRFGLIDSPLDQITIADLRIEGALAKERSFGISAFVADTCHIRNVDIYGSPISGFVAVSLDTTRTNTDVKRVLVEFCRSVNCGVHGFKLGEQLRGAQIFHCSTVDTNLGDMGAAIFLMGDEQSVHDSRVMNAHDNGIRIHGRRCVVANNIVEGFSTDGIRLAGDEGLAVGNRVLAQRGTGAGYGIRIRDAHHCRVIGNTVSESQIGIMVQNRRGRDPDHAIVSGNHTRNSVNSGIAVSGGKNHQISGNTCLNNGSERGTRSGIEIWESTNSICSSNICNDDRDSKLQNHGIYLHPSTAGWLVEGNMSPAGHNRSSGITSRGDNVLGANVS